MGHVSGTSGSRYSDNTTRWDNVILQLPTYIDDYYSEMKTGPYSVTMRPEEVTMRANRSVALSPNLSPTTVTTFSSVLQFVGGGSVDAVVWSLEPPPAGYVCCLISRQSFLAQQHPVATDGQLRHTVTALRYAVLQALSVAMAALKTYCGPFSVPRNGGGGGAAGSCSTALH
jgi:hypothetical protein